MSTPKSITIDRCQQSVVGPAMWDRPHVCNNPVKETIDGKGVCGVHARSMRQRKEAAERFSRELAASRDATSRRSDLTQRLGTNVGYHSNPMLGVVSLDFLDNLRPPRNGR